MLKKLIKIATVLSLLGATHIAYIQAFSYVVDRLQSARPVEDTDFEVQDSQTKQLAREISREAFGAGHWTDSDKLLRYYNSNRGFYLYTLKFSRPTEEAGVKFDGKRVTLEPAAVVLRSADGKGTKTITSERAIIDFNQSFGFSVKPNPEPTTVKFARLEQNVMIRDDRGTPDDPSDDLVIGPLSYVDYDDETLQIRTDSDVEVVDRDLRLTGSGLEIQLRAKDPSPGPGNHSNNGFNGAQRAILLKNIRMVFGDVGRAGLLPGTVKDAGGRVEAVAAANANAENAAEPTPLDLQCDGPMTVELPASPPPVEVGPPAPPAPTFVEFQRNVVVRRGKLSVDPDQLNCDTLHLTLLPGAPKPEDEAKRDESPAEEEKNVFGGLALRRAKASGHAVWLQLPGQGAKVRCVELLHHKDPFGGKNTTIFHGGGAKKLWVEKQDVAQEGPDRGKVQSVTHIWCADATLMDEGDMDRATLVANGPGLLESRAGAAPPRDAPPDRIVSWQDQFWLQNELDASGAITGKVLVLKGSPRVQDRTQAASLDAKESIVVWLNADEAAPEGSIKTADARDVVPAAYTVAEGEAAAAEAPPAAARKPAGPAIRRLLAVKDVHLVAPARDLRARDRLDVDFEQAKLTTTPPAQGQAPAARPPDEPALDPNAPANSDVGDQSANQDKPDEPLMTASADRAQAKVLVGPRPQGAPAGAVPLPGAENSNYEIRDVELRGGVVLHQDPQPGKEKGLDATGEVLILLNEGPGKAIFDLYHHDPYSAKGRAVDPEAAPRARVSTEEMTIEAKVIGVNQKTNEAWAHGAGKLVQMTDRALLTDRSAETLEGAEDRPADRRRAGKALPEKTPITITWDEKMTFQGVAADPLNRPAAKAKFHKNARAEMRDALLYGGESITTYTDRIIPLAEAGKLSQKPGADDNDEADEPKPDLALIECEGGAVAISRKVDPDRPVLIGMQKIKADSLTYDRRSGGFVAPGPGVVHLYDRTGDPLTTRDDEVSNTSAPIATSRVVRPIAYRPDQDGEGDGEGEGDERVAVRPVDAAGIAQPERPQTLLRPLVLTQIKFETEMRGRFGTGRADDVTEQRWAEFFGAVETARAEVPNERTVFNYDRLPSNASFMTSEMLRVVTEPPPPGEASSSGGRYFLKAWDNAYVTARDTTLQADVITYDSLNDLIYANGLDGRPVQIVQQAAVGQPGSPLRVAAVRMNPRTGAADVIDPQALQLVDAQTGVRPKAVPAPKPQAEGDSKTATRPRKPPRRPPTNPAERRGFTGR